MGRVETWGCSQRLRKGHRYQETSQLPSTQEKEAVLCWAGLTSGPQGSFRARVLGSQAPESCCFYGGLVGRGGPRSSTRQPLPLALSCPGPAWKPQVVLELPKAPGDLCSSMAAVGFGLLWADTFRGLQGIWLVCPAKVLSSASTHAPLRRIGSGCVSPFRGLGPAWSSGVNG